MPNVTPIVCLFLNNMSSIAEFLSDTLKAYKITATALCEASGVHRSRISEIVKGKVDPRASTIEALLDGLEKIKPSARVYFCMRLAQTALPVIKSESIETMDLVELSTLLGLIASRFQSEQFLQTKIFEQSRRQQSATAPQEMVEDEPFQPALPTSSVMNTNSASTAQG